MREVVFVPEELPADLPNRRGRPLTLAGFRARYVSRSGSRATAATVALTATRHYCRIHACRD